MVYHIPSEINNCLEHNQSNQNIPEEIPTHKIVIKSGSILSKLTGKEQADVNSFHRQSVKEPGTGLMVSAQAPDGVVEALESVNHSFVTKALLSAAPVINKDSAAKRIILEGTVPTPVDPPPGCRFASRCFAKKGPECLQTEPEGKELSPGHWVACHLYEG